MIPAPGAVCHIDSSDTSSLNQFMRVSAAPVLFSGGDAAPDVALGLVELQNLPGLEVEPPVIERQPLGDILVYGCR